MFIRLTYNNYSRSNNRKFNLRADLIERISEGFRGGSCVTLTTGTYYNVKELMDDVTILVMVAEGRLV